MAFIPVPNTVGISIRYTFQSQQCENTLNFEVSDSGSDTVLQTVASDVLGWAESELMPQLSNQVTLREVHAVNRAADGGIEYTAVPTGVVVGGQSGAALPSNATITISLRTGFSGRSYRGRNYIVGVPEAARLDTDHIGSDYLSAVQTAYNLLTVDGGFTAGALGVVSLYHNKAPRVTGVIRTVTAVLFTDNVIDSQRRRLPGRGR